MNENVVLIGAGSAMFTRGLVADILRQGWEGGLTLVDTDPKALEVAERLCQKMLQARNSSLALRATVDRRQALPGATAVICTIGVGGRRAWEQDVFVPRQHGIYQPVGDSVMPGGTSRALRMLPPMVAIAEDVLDLAPQALFFNYGNPMGVVCRGVHKATGANMIGLCHGVFDVAAHIAGCLSTTREAMAYTALGMNHLTWFTDIRIGTEDAMPRLREVARQKLGIGVNPDRLGTRSAEAGTAKRDATEGIDNPFTWALVNLFGAFPAVLDRHITEFFPHLFCREHGYYGKTLGVDAFSLEQTIEYGDRIFEDMTELAMSDAPLPADYFDKLGGEHEQVTAIIESLRQGDGAVYSANLPNRGQIPNLPADAVVECPAVAETGRLRAIDQPPLPPGLAGTLATRFQWVETTVEAALEGNRTKFVQALLIDGAVTSVEAAWRLANDLLDAQRQYLPQFVEASRRE